MIVVWEYFVLQWQEGVVGIDQVDVWQVVLFGYFLCVQVFFDCYWVVCVVFDGGIVGYDYVFYVGYVVDVGDYVCVWDWVVIYVVCGQWCDFQECVVWIEQCINVVVYQQFVVCGVFLLCCFVVVQCCLCQCGMQVVYYCL